MRATFVWVSQCVHNLPEASTGGGVVADAHVACAVLPEVGAGVVELEGVRVVEIEHSLVLQPDLVTTAISPTDGFDVPAISIVGSAWIVEASRRSPSCP